MFPIKENHPINEITYSRKNCNIGGEIKARTDPFNLTLDFGVYTIQGIQISSAVQKQSIPYFHTATVANFY